MGCEIPPMSPQELRKRCREWLNEDMEGVSIPPMYSVSWKNRDMVCNFQTVRSNYDCSEELDMSDGNMLNIMCASAFGLFLDVTIATMANGSLVNITEDSSSGRVIFLDLTNNHFLPMRLGQVRLFKTHQYTSLVPYPLSFVGKDVSLLLAMREGGLISTESVFEEDLRRLEHVMASHLKGEHMFCRELGPLAKSINSLVDISYA